MGNPWPAVCDQPLGGSIIGLCAQVAKRFHQVMMSTGLPMLPNAIDD